MDGSSAEPSMMEDTQTSKRDDAVAPASAPAERTPEELVAKAMAPVKKEFLRPPPIRSSTSQPDDAATQTEPKSSASLIKEKKSKRQLKRERRQVLPQLVLFS